MLHTILARSTAVMKLGSFANALGSAMITPRDELGQRVVDGEMKKSNQE